MRLLSTISTLLLSVSTVISASVDDVYNDITALDQDVQDLTSMVRGYQGGLIAQGPLLLQLTKVHHSSLRERRPQTYRARQHNPFRRQPYRSRRSQVEEAIVRCQWYGSIHQGWIANLA
jgi:hypothetical protein